MGIFVFGYKQHGKDSACEYLRDRHGFTFASSSETANQVFIFDRLKKEFGYKTLEECFADRVNHRERWYEEIRAFNAVDKARLGKIILSSNDGYCGIRDDEEFAELRRQGFVDLSIWIDASARKEPESKKSMKLSIADADIVVDNNGDIFKMHHQLDDLYARKIAPLISLREYRASETKRTCFSM